MASSIVEFEKQRIEIGYLLGKIQNKLIDYDIEIELFKCEYDTACVSKSLRKQDKTNIELSKSNIFIMLVGKRTGKYTIEEFLLANSFNNIQKNIIFYEDKNKSESDMKDILNFKDKIRKMDNVIIYECASDEDIKQSIIRIISEYLKNI